MSRVLSWSTRPRAAVVVCTMALSTLALISPAHARAQGTSSVAAVNRRVAEVLEANPGSRRISDTSVLLAPGIIMTVPGPVETRATMTVPSRDGGQVTVSAASTSCPYQYLCLWEHVWRGGERLAFYYCGYVDLYKYRLNASSYWNNKVSSIWNNQSGGVVSWFYDTNYGGLLGTVSAGNYLQDLTRDRALDGGNWNDRIDRVKVC
jgi:peptidase inhibitor family I36